MLFTHPKKIISEIISKLGGVEKSYADTWLQAFQMPSEHILSMALSSHLFCSSSDTQPSIYAISRLGTLLAEKREQVEEKTNADFFLSLFASIHEGLQKRTLSTENDMTTSLLLVTINDNFELLCLNAGYCKALLYRKHRLFSIEPSTSKQEDQMSLPLGMIDPIKLSYTKPEVAYTQQKLKKGDVVLLLSPDIMEQSGAPKSLLQVCEQNKDPSVICHRILDIFQTDDTSDSTEPFAQNTVKLDDSENIAGCIRVI